MARRRHHRRLHGISTLNLGALPILGDSAEVMDIVIGVGLGFVGAAAVKAAAKKFVPTIWAQVESNVGMALPLVTGIASAAVVYFAEKKLLGNTRRATGHAAGALMAGVVLSGWDILKKQAPAYFNDAVSLNLGSLGNYGGLLVNDQMSGFGGMLVSDRSDNLAQLAAMSMSGDDGMGDGGLLDLAGM